MPSNGAVYDWLAKHSDLASLTAGHGSQKYQLQLGQVVLSPSPKGTGQAGFLANFARLLVNVVIGMIVDISAIFVFWHGSVLHLCSHFRPLL